MLDVGGGHCYVASSVCLCVDDDCKFLCKNGRTDCEVAWNVDLHGIKEPCAFEGVSGPLNGCLLYTSPSPRDRQKSRMPSSA